RTLLGFRHRVGFEKGAERAKRLASMTHRGFLVRCGLAESSAVRRIEKDWVVPKSAYTLWLRRDLTLDGATRLERHSPALRQRQRADEASRSVVVWHAGERVVNQCKLRGIRNIDTAVTRRLYSGGTVERIDFEPRVLCHDQRARCVCVIQRLLSRVLVEGPSSLFGRDDVRPAVECDELETHAREQRANLADFVRIGRCDN